MAVSNVSLFFEYAQPPLVPDVMLSLNVPAVETRRESDHRSYFSWIIGKMPDVVIEIVSDRRGGEDSSKMQNYLDILIPYYVIYDPEECLLGDPLRAFALKAGKYEAINPLLFPTVGLGLKLWTGFYEGDTEEWLRWCNAKGQLIRTGREQAEWERKRGDRQKERAEEQKERAERAEEKMRMMAERLRALGEDVDS